MAELAKAARKSVRYRIQHKLRYSRYRIDGAADFIEGETKDMSQAGLAFQSRLGFAEGDLILIEVNLPGWQRERTGFMRPLELTNGVPFRFIGRVRWCHMTGTRFSVGVSFESIDHDHQRAVGKYLSKRFPRELGS